MTGIEYYSDLPTANQSLITRSCDSTTTQYMAKCRTASYRISFKVWYRQHVYTCQHASNTFSCIKKMSTYTLWSPSRQPLTCHTGRQPCPFRPLIFPHFILDSGIIQDIKVIPSNFHHRLHKVERNQDSSDKHLEQFTCLLIYLPSQLLASANSLYHFPSPTDLPNSKMDTYLTSLSHSALTQCPHTSTNLKPGSSRCEDVMKLREAMLLGKRHALGHD